MRIFALVTALLFGACGAPPPPDLPIPGNPPVDSVDAGSTSPDAGTTPADPCEGLKPPLATRCSTDGAPPYTVYPKWTLQGIPPPDSRCYMGAPGVGFYLTKDMSGAPSFSCTSTAGENLICIQ